MQLDLSACEIRVPVGESVPPLYEFLSSCFPSDRPIFDELTRTGRRFYTWTPYVLYRGAEILGTLALMPMRVWLRGQATTVMGVASVATAPQYRRQGVARHLLRHALNLVDRQPAPCVLFTGQPDVYRGAGFRAVSQRYLAAPVRSMNFRCPRYDRETMDRLADSQIPELERTYAEQYPDYDGKIDRDPDYWQLYAMLFNGLPKSSLLCCRDRGQLLGYARFDQDGDRLTVCELCAWPSRVDVAEALLGSLREEAVPWGVELMSFALPPDHFAWSVLRRHRIALCDEPPGVAREAFMVRPAVGRACEGLLQLQWSLADKF